ncbi:MAG TPA: glycerophosphodiester phosphodiesterase family protein [Actinophytocola sp.]|uniref:glycerophosphodiester phosphodiesterase family protein n=1 Tax=Actinophytocola sp. TaxID=1872138 RepID=UPI002DBEB224|nr:glycerophosphodiester phosphodiesterase family protein [Actinophytocola sp.]HEU5473816.1 glycerophosphodiester phosphodiesterase family protein [Actinophytocola sp.]
MHAFLAGPHPRAFVHRGWHAGDLAGMENSLCAFRRAVQEGYRYLETDVHATSDGVVVVHHDPLLDRTTDGTGPIAALPWRTVRQARIGGREPVVRLEELLEELPDALFNIDVKAEAAVEPLVAALRRTNAVHRVCVASFSESRLARVRRLAGQAVLTSMGTGAIARLWAARRLPAGVFRAARRQRIAQVPVRQGRLTLVDRRMIAMTRRRGIEVHVWTIDDAPQMHQLLDLGVDGIMTDHPDVLKEVLRERGVWASST